MVGGRGGGVLRCHACWAAKSPLLQRASISERAQEQGNPWAAALYWWVACGQLWLCHRRQPAPQQAPCHCVDCVAPRRLGTHYQPTAHRARTRAPPMRPAGNRTLLLTTQWRCRGAVVAVDLDTGKVAPLTPIGQLSSHSLVAAAGVWCGACGCWGEGGGHSLCMRIPCCVHAVQRVGAAGAVHASTATAGDEQEGEECVCAFCRPCLGGQQASRVAPRGLPPRNLFT